MFSNDDNAQQLPKAKPVIGWPGGKRKLLKYLLPLVPEHDMYCEVFGGGLAMFLGKAESPAEVINDINSELTSFYKVVQSHIDPLLAELEYVLNSSEIFIDYLAQPGLTDIQRAARWFIRNKLSFGAMGFTFGVSKQCRSSSLGSRSNRLLAIRALNRRLNNVCIEHVPWEQCLKIYDRPGCFFFFDPPYIDAGGEAYAGWTEEELTKFCLRIRELKGKWLFTFQDCPLIHRLMQGFKIKQVVRHNGIGNNGADRTGRVYREVIISSDLRCAVPQRKYRPGKRISHP